MHEDTVPCLVALADEFDQVGDDRDTASDGSIGDAAHQNRSSNHNRDDTSAETPQTDSDGEPDIRAIDVDKSGPWRNGFTMQQGVDLIVSRCRSGAEDRLVEVIYNKKCWYRSNGWKEQTYTGSNPHTEHAHFGAKADTGKLENDTRPWGIEEKWGDMDQATFNARMDAWAATPNGKRALCSANHEDTVPMTGADGELLPDAGASSRMAPDTALKNINQRVIQISNLLAPPSP